MLEPGELSATVEALHPDHEQALAEPRPSIEHELTIGIEHEVEFRPLFSALAYMLMQRLREKVLRGTESGRASAATIRVRLLKIDAEIMCNTRRVRTLLYLASSATQCLPTRLTPWPRSAAEVLTPTRYKAPEIGEIVSAAVDNRFPYRR